MSQPGGAGAALQGMDRKVQQLTKVIYHLNAKGEEAANDLGEKAAQYENEIEGILREAGERVKRFQAACSHTTDAKVISDKVREVEVKYEMQKQRALREMEEFKKRAKDANVRREKQRRAARACRAARRTDPVSFFATCACMRPSPV